MEGVTGLGSPLSPLSAASPTAKSKLGERYLAQMRQANEDHSNPSPASGGEAMDDAAWPSD